MYMYHYFPTGQPVIEYKVRYLNGNNSVGGIIEMVCAATGSPPPIVTVKRQLSSETVILKNATQRVVYSIANPQPSDNGKYVCIAKNIAGDVEKDVLVEVKCKLTVFLMYCMCLSIFVKSHDLTPINRSTV